MEQSDLDDLADNLQVRFEVLDNISDGQKKFKAQIVLTNHSSHTLTSADKWAIYFCLMRMIEPDALPEAHSCLNEESHVIFSHINGCLFKLEPATEFEALTPGSAIGITFHAQHYCVAKTDIFPNWYLTAPNCQPRLIRSTVDETLSFVADFDTPMKWKRFDHPTPSGQKFDHYNPFTPEERFERNARASESVKAKPVIPTPLNVKYTDDEYVELSRDSWVIYCDSALIQVANYLAEKVSLPIHDSLPVSGKEYIELRVAPGELCDLGGEGYHLTVAPEKPFIQIIGADHPGVFYGVQTLLQLLDNKHRVPQVQISDAPRFEYRGMHLDVVRNFHDVDSVKLLIEAMAMYNLNKLHLHLTDDEGWRIEIPRLHELTEIGGRVGHDLTETTCILPVLGSGPDMKSGFYSVQDYQDILRYAKNRHVEIIPEIDMPGHAHAAIKSMCVRYSKSGENLSGEFSLAGEREGKDHHSVQKYVNNAFDPGLESTFNFIDKVIQELVKMHAQVSPLKLFHFGGDEVPMELWQTYIACQKLIKKSVVKEESKLMEYFVTRVSQLTQKYGLNLGAWQDGILFEDKSLIERKKLENIEVFTYAWLNRWELGLADSGNRLANAGYKIRTTEDFFIWLNGTALPALFQDNYSDGSRRSYWDRYLMSDLQSFRVGPPRLRQVRTAKLYGCEHISIPYAFCNTQYHIGYGEEETDFCFKWKDPPCPDDEVVTKFSSTAWQFTSSSNVWGMPVVGRYNTYSGGGYIAQMDVNTDVSMRILKELFEGRWVDRQTRAVALEFTIYNANVNIFCYVSLMAEFPETGGVIKYALVAPLRVYHHVGALGTYMLCNEILFLLFLLIAFVNFVTKIKQFGISYLDNPWHIVDFVYIMGAFIGVGLYWVRADMTKKTISLLHDDRRHFVNFHHIAMWDKVLVTVIGIVSASVTIRTIKISGYNRRVSGIWRVLTNAGRELLCFTIIFFILFVSFVILGYMLFGTQLESYQTVLLASATLMNSITGNTPVDEMRSTQPLLAPFYFLLFVFLVVIVLLGMFITILKESSAFIRSLDTGDSSQNEMLKLLINPLLEWLRQLFPSIKRYTKDSKGS